MLKDKNHTTALAPHFHSSSMPESNGHKAADECMAPPCHNKVKTRGLCLQCYTATRLFIKNFGAEVCLGNPSWELLERNGLALPPISMGERVERMQAGRGIDPKTKKKNKRGKCLVPECEQDAKSRGLCTPCYMFARRCVLKGEVTWEQLEAGGQIYPMQKHFVSNDRYKVVKKSRQAFFTA